MCLFSLIVLVLSMLFRRAVLFSFFFFFKQKTAYEMRISDWSSDVCSSDLVALEHAGEAVAHLGRGQADGDCAGDVGGAVGILAAGIDQVEIGRASCRERVWQYV